MKAIFHKIFDNDSLFFIINHKIIFKKKMLFFQFAFLLFAFLLFFLLFTFLLFFYYLHFYFLIFVQIKSFSILIEYGKFKIFFYERKSYVLLQRYINRNYLRHIRIKSNDFLSLACTAGFLTRTTFQFLKVIIQVLEFELLCIQF